MAHPEQTRFCLSIKEKYSEYFADCLVIDIGSLDVNGNNQYLFSDCLYIGVDLAAGRNVDFTSRGHELALPDASVDVIISTECFEHDQFYHLTLTNIVRVLKPGGLFLFTCATTGRMEHGTRRSNPQDAPFLQELAEWGDYYQNLEETDIRAALDVDSVFADYSFSTNIEAHDLYFWGRKKGVLVPRRDYSFQIARPMLRDMLGQSYEHITKLHQTLIERDRQVFELNRTLTERDRQVSELNRTLTERDRQVSELNRTLTERDRQVFELNRTLTERDRQVFELNRTLTERDRQVLELNQTLVEYDRQAFELNRTIAKGNQHVSDLKMKEAVLERQLSALYQSSSWRITAPLRNSTLGVRVVSRAIGRPINFGLFLFLRSIYVIRHHGLRNFLIRSNRFVRYQWWRKTAQYQFKSFQKKSRSPTDKREAESRPVVSFIIPVHNRTDMLRTAIHSVLDQTFRAIEAIIVTNGSPAETLAVLDEFRDDSRVRVFDYFRDNTGNAVRGRNKGILEARGDYIAFLDSDDIADPRRIELSLPLLTSGKADVAYGAWQVMMDGTRQVDGLSDGQVVHSPDCDLEMLTRINVPYQSTVILRKRLFETAGFLKPQMYYREDHELWARLATHGAIFKSVPDVLTRIRLHSGNTELNFKSNDAHWEKLMAAEYKRRGPRPAKIAFLLGGVGINGGMAVVFRHIMMLMAAGHDAFAINLGDNGDGGAWFTGNTAPIVHISDKRKYLFENIDMLFATGWMTVAWLSVISARRKLYFVQADERQFVEEAALKEKIHGEYKTECEYLTEALWIQKMLYTEFGHQSAYVPNGIDPTVFHPDTPLETKNPKRLRVLIEGPICIPYKGMDDAYAAIAPLDCEIWIVSSVGRPKPGWRYDRFFEGVPFGEMRKIYSSCDVFLKMSCVEGFFGPPMEAMACGCSVVVGEVSGYDEYITHDKNALVVEQGDVDGARRAVQRLLNDYALRDKLVKQGFETAKAWTWERSAQAMLELVEIKENYNTQEKFLASLNHSLSAPGDGGRSSLHSESGTVLAVPSTAASKR